MNQEPMVVEFVQIMIPGEEYEKKLYRLVVALLESLEKDQGEEEDIKAKEMVP